MPIYEYQCSACGYHYEALQKISDAPLTQCPECGKDSLSKLLSATSFRLKGGGWYETDFKSGKKQNLASDEKVQSKPSSSTEAKPDAKPKPKSSDTKGDQ